MKKLISCLLAVLLVCSLMSMSVFAADVTITDCTVDGCTAPDCTHHAVGKPGHGDINNGVGENDGSFGNNNNVDVTVNFGQTTNDDGSTDPDDNTNSVIIHRYAVDITYGSFLLDLTDLELDTNGDDVVNNTDENLFMVWDVTDHKYVLCFWDETNSKYVPADIGGTKTNGTTEDDVAADVLQTPVKLPGYVTITNHSDLSVNSEVEITAETNTGISWAIDKEADATADRDTGADSYNNEKTVVNQLIGKALAATDGNPGAATNGTTYNFTATPTDADGWLGVIGNFVNNNPTNAKIGTITVTISK